MKSTLQRLAGALAWLFRHIARIWQRLLCGLFNFRRRVFRTRLPDYVVFELDNALLERTPDQPRIYSLLPIGQPPTTLESLTDAFHAVAKDPDVRGILLMVKGGSMSLAQAQSMRDLLDRFRHWDRAHNNHSPESTPKRIAVYLEQGSNALQVMASTADTIVMPPESHWGVFGLFAEDLYLADSLASLGVKFDAVKIAPWKTAFDSLVRSDMSDAAIDQTNWLLDSLYEDLINAIAHGRKLEPSQVKEQIDQAPLRTEQAQAAGLIDAAAYEDQLPRILSDADSGEASLGLYRKVRGYLLRLPRRPLQGKIGVISMRGMILPGKSRNFPIELPLFGRNILGSATAQQEVRLAMKDDSLSAVVVHIDSQGGSAAASDLIWRELKLLARKKPLVAYMGDVAASGGYYISTPAQRVVAQPATVTGSIGVISGKPVTAGTYDRIKARRYSFQRGANADIYRDLHAWEGAQRERVEEEIHHAYVEFKQRVADGRQLAFDELDEICSGKVWTGAQALEHGLVTHIGGFSTAVDTACELASLPKDDSVRVTNVRPRRPMLPISTGELGIQNPKEFASLLETVGSLIQGEWESVLGREHLWYWADDYPRPQ